MKSKIIVLSLLLLIYSCSTKNTNIYFSEVMSKNSGLIYSLEGKSSDWVELYNNNNSSTDLDNYIIVKNDDFSNSYQLKNINLNGKETLIIWCSGITDNKYKQELHAPFKLSSSGFNLKLYNNKILIDEINVPELDENVSYGIESNNREIIGILSDPSPNESNWSSVLKSKKVLIKPIFSKPGGFYEEDFVLELHSPENSLIYYTIDGSEPTPFSILYEDGIHIKDISSEPDILSYIEGTAEDFRYPRKKSFKGVVIKAITYELGKSRSEIVTNTYFINEKGRNRYSYPVVSLTTDRRNLFDFNTGIYMLGYINKIWKEENPNSKIQGDNPANFNQRGKGWSVPYTMEYFPENNNNSISSMGRMRIMGGWSRANPVKSLRLDFNSPINNIFENIPIKKIDSLVFRTSANDWDYTLFRDSLMTDLVDGFLETQESKPAILFINGEYWGIHNIRERITPEYFESHFNINKQNISVLENNGELSEGNIKGVENYKKIVDFVTRNELSNIENYNYIKQKIDIENYINYISTQIFYGNTDWPGNNIRYWQDSVTDSKWRWILYDTDFGFGLYDWTGGVNNNTIKVVMDPVGAEWPNPSWSTLLFRSLMKNDNFKYLFLSRFSDLINSNFREINLKEKINEYKTLYSKGINEHINRWSNSGGNIKSWNEKIDVMINFSEKRQLKILNHIDHELNLKGLSRLKIGDFVGGSISINSLNGINGNWSGYYFNEIPIKVEVTEYNGYTFKGWKELNSNNKVVEVIIDKDLNLTPIFIKNN